MSVAGRLHLLIPGYQMLLVNDWCFIAGPSSLERETGKVEGSENLASALASLTEAEILAFGNRTARYMGIFGLPRSA